MNEKKLTTSQVKALSGYERFFRQATVAAWCSYPGQAAIDVMLTVWKEVTGSDYPYKRGCPNCLMNLVRDMGYLYFAAKEARPESAPATESTQAPAPGSGKKSKHKTKKG